MPTSLESFHQPRILLSKHWGLENFERVIKALRDTKRILEVYGGVPSSLIETLQSDADGLRELLVQTIASSHPAWPGEITDEEYAACREFLGHFNTIYTFNYDLLLYWAQMHTPEGVAPSSDDGFRKSEDDYDAGYVVWEPSQSHEQNIYFLHGALHVFDTGTEIQKYTWINTGVRLIDQIRHALSKDYYPLFVLEGTSAEKLERIRHNDYLAKAYRSFSEIQGALFIYGHSLAENDEHYLKRIERGKLSQLYIGLYGDPNSDANKRIVLRANRMSNSRRAKALLVSPTSMQPPRKFGENECRNKVSAITGDSYADCNSNLQDSLEDLSQRHDRLRKKLVDFFELAGYSRLAALRSGASLSTVTLKMTSSR